MDLNGLTGLWGRVAICDERARAVKPLENADHAVHFSRGETTRSLSIVQFARPLAAKWFGQENPGRTSYLSNSPRNISAFLRFTTSEMLFASLAKAHWSR